MRRGYMSLVHDYNISALRLIRGDNYCAIRSVLHELLCRNPRALINACDSFSQRANTLQMSRSGFLQQWTFAGRIQDKPHEVLNKISECNSTLLEAAYMFEQEQSTEERFQRAALMFTAGECELRMLEAVKMLMLCLFHRFMFSFDSIPLFISSSHYRSDGLRV